ncbi:MAG: hypothetical protein ABI041_16010, partial [Bdellovibrionia bacterium]
EQSLAVLCVASLGTGSIVKGALKSVEKIAGLARVGHRVEVAEHALKDAVVGAEKIAGKISGYTNHGLNQAISRNDGKGVHPKAILDAIRSPIKTVVQESNNTVKYVGGKATVILNETGEIVTVWAKKAPRN